MRALSLEVTSRGIAFGVLEGTDRLLDWGGRRNGQTEAVIADLFTTSRAEVLILEEPMTAKKGRHAIRSIVTAARTADDRGVPVVAVAFMPRCRFRAADRLAATFPELERALPARRASWHVHRPNLDHFIAIDRARHVLGIFERTCCKPTRYGPRPHWYEDAQNEKGLDTPLAED